MKLGVLTTSLAHLTLEEVVEYLAPLGVGALEIGAGGYPGSAHLDVAKILEGDEEAARIKELVSSHSMVISAISAHGNPLHPDKEIAESFHNAFISAILVAEKLGVDTVVGFSGCPGDSEGSKYPNWVTCAWPDDFGKILEWQWEEKIIPYWKKTVEFALSHGVTKIALELHPGFSVYNTESLLRLREAVGDIIGANFDPSHLFWQGIDPVEAIKALGPAIHHFHAKDTFVDRRNCEVNGVLDTKSYGRLAERSWYFRTVGYGNSEKKWKDILSALALVGYNGSVSIEHEDALMSINEGLEKAVALLRSAIPFENPCDPFWI